MNCFLMPRGVVHCHVAETGAPLNQVRQTRAAGPLSGSLVRMDDAWLRAVAGKDSLFPSDWPMWAWAA